MASIRQEELWSVKFLGGSLWFSLWEGTVIYQGNKRQQHTMYGGCNSPREIVQLFVKREMEARGLETYQLSSETRSTTLQSNRSIISGQCICCWIYWQASKSACSSSIIFFLSHQQHRSWARALFFEYYRYYHLYWPTSCCHPGQCCLLMGMSHNYLWC